MLLTDLSRVFVTLLGAAALYTAAASGHEGRAETTREEHPAGHWVAAWTTMPQLTEPANLPNAPFNTTGLVFGNTTVRQTIHVTATSGRIRLRISNAFGTTSLPITNVTVARPLDGAAGSAAIDPRTVKRLTFSGSPSFSIPNGALVVSDAVDFEVKAATELTISIFLAEGQVGNDITSHPGSRTTTWMSFGNQVEAGNITGASTQSVAHWFFISTLEAWVPARVRTVAIVGDSITDGRGSDTDRNNRWPDLVLARLQSSGDESLRTVAVVNQAAGGNRILADGLGPNALGRFDRDVVSQPGVRYTMIFEGVNDIGTAGDDEEAQAAVGDALIAAYKQFVVRAHAAGLPVFAATITPFSAPGFNASMQAYSSAVREATRQRVNSFVRDGGWFDAVADFDAVVRDPAAPSQLSDVFDSGDFLHPNVAGYAAIAHAFPLDVFRRFERGVGGY